MGIHLTLARLAAGNSPSKCSTCTLGQICLPVGLSAEEAIHIDHVVTERIRLKKGQTLYTMSDSLDAVYGIRFGTLKTHVTLEDGRIQITGFHLPGEIIGFDGLFDMHHTSDATALEDSEVCVMHYSRLEELSHNMPSLQRQLTRLMSKEIARDHLMLLALGSMRAEERLAAFLLNLSQRFAVRGYSSTEFVLRMSREEIGSFLGLKLETVSRLFSRFAEAGLLQIKQRHVKIIDLSGLRHLLQPGS